MPRKELVAQLEQLKEEWINDNDFYWAGYLQDHNLPLVEGVESFIEFIKNKEES